MSLYNMAQPVGAMLSGAMQGALSTNFDGLHGRAGWRWAFIINGVCTIAIAIAGFFLLPGYPDRPNPLSRFYLTPRHIEIAQARGRRVSRKPQIGITVKSFVRCFSYWQLWAMAIAWPFGGNWQPTNYFNLWLKSLSNADGTKRYSTAMLNYLPIAGQAETLVTQVLFNGLSDYIGARLPFLLLHSVSNSLFIYFPDLCGPVLICASITQVINITSLVILTIRPSNEHAYMAGWYLNYNGACSTMLLCSWASQNLEEQPEVRTVMFASGTVVAYILSAFVPLAAYPASEAPNWRIGAKLYLAFAIFAVPVFIALHFGFKWEQGKKAKSAMNRR